MIQVFVFAMLALLVISALIVLRTAYEMWDAGLRITPLVMAVCAVGLIAVVVIYVLYADTPPCETISINGVAYVQVDCKEAE